MDIWKWLQLGAIPLAGALTGYVTNWIAVRMLFRPRRARRIVAWDLHGLIPRRRRELAERIAETIEEHLLSHEDVRRALEHPDVRRRLEGLVRSHIDEAVERRLTQGVPLLGGLLGRGMGERIKQSIHDEVVALLPRLTEQAMEALETQLDFRRMIVERIDTFEIERLEAIVRGIAARELRAIELLGGVIGFAVGLMTMGLLLL